MVVHFLGIIGAKLFGLDVTVPLRIAEIVERAKQILDRRRRQINLLSDSPVSLGN